MTPRRRGIAALISTALILTSCASTGDQSATSGPERVTAPDRMVFADDPESPAEASVEPAPTTEAPTEAPTEATFVEAAPTPEAPTDPPAIVEEPTSEPTDSAPAQDDGPADSEPAPTQVVAVTDDGEIIDEPVVESGERIAAPIEITPAMAPFQFFAETLEHGDIVDGLDLYIGRPTIITFVVPSCPICQTEGPEIAETAARNTDIMYVLVHGQGERADYLEFNARAGLDQPNVLHIVDDDGSLWRRFGVVQQPTSILVRSDGEVTSSRGALGTTNEGLDLVAYYVRNEEPPPSLHRTLQSPPPEASDA